MADESGSDKKVRAWRVREHGDDLITYWLKHARHSNEYAAAEIIEQLEREVADLRSTLDTSRLCTQERDRRVSELERELAEYTARAERAEIAQVEASMREPDNIGATDRWEDPRDLSGGETGCAPSAKPTPEGRGSPPAGALESGSPYDAARDATPGGAAPGGVASSSAERSVFEAWIHAYTSLGCDRESAERMVRAEIANAQTSELPCPDPRGHLTKGEGKRCYLCGAVPGASSSSERRRDAPSFEAIMDEGESWRDEMASPSHATSNDETAWLIEMPAGRWGSGYYWTGPEHFNSWGTIDEAVRFARKEDAERVMKKLTGYAALEACEHSWPSTPIAASATTTSEEEARRQAYHRDVGAWAPPKDGA